MKSAREHRTLPSIQHASLKRLSLVLIALALVIVFAWPARAAILLSYFAANSTNSAVNLEWGTLSEVNVEGYKIYMKQDGQSDSAYHVVGTKIAKGGPDTPADYAFSVTTDMVYGAEYCFRLEESTTDGTPGDQHDICGFGPGVTPTPVLDATAAAFAGTLTPIVVTPPPGAQPPPTLITPQGQSPLSTPDGTPTVTPSGTPQNGDNTATPTTTATTVASPIDGPTPTWTQPASPLSQADADATANAASASNGSNGSPTSPLATPSPPETPPPTMTETPTVTSEPSQTMTLAPSPTDSGMAAMTETADASVLASATSMYVVQTATATPVQATPTPTLTPLPTVTPTPELGLMGFLSPSGQNMVVLMLCLIFLSASGLGSLGLLIAVLYYRSQNQRR